MEYKVGNVAEMLIDIPKNRTQDGAGANTAERVARLLIALGVGNLLAVCVWITKLFGSIAGLPKNLTC